MYNFNEDTAMQGHNEPAPADNSNNNNQQDGEYKVKAPSYFPCLNTYEGRILLTRELYAFQTGAIRSDGNYLRKGPPTPPEVHDYARKFNNDGMEICRRQSRNVNVDVDIDVHSSEAEAKAKKLHYAKTLSKYMTTQQRVLSRVHKAPSPSSPSPLHLHTQTIPIPIANPHNPPPAPNLTSNPLALLIASNARLTTQLAALQDQHAQTEAQLAESEAGRKSYRVALERCVEREVQYKETNEELARKVVGLRGKVRELEGGGRERVREMRVRERKVEVGRIQWEGDVGRKVEVVLEWVVKMGMFVVGCVREGRDTVVSLVWAILGWWLHLASRKA